MGTRAPFGLEVPVPYRAVPRSREVSAIEEARRALDAAGLAILAALKALRQLDRPRHVAVPGQRRQ
jgi:hypothetical protein